MGFRQELPSQIKLWAKEQAHSVGYWFRRKYNLSPKDPRYLEMEPWEIDLEYETEVALDEELKVQSKNYCKVCGQFVDGNICPTCGNPPTTEQYFDPDYDEYEDQIEKENEEYFSKKKDKDDWVELEEEHAKSN